jgi:hypothetical protein
MHIPLAVDCIVRHQGLFRKRTVLLEGVFEIVQEQNLFTTCSKRVHNSDLSMYEYSMVSVVRIDDHYTFT